MVGFTAALYLAALAAAVSFGLCSNPWLLAGVQDSPRPFLDWDNVLAAVHSARLGFDPLVVNPCDVFARPLNYPRVWLVLGWIGAQRNWLLPGGVILGSAALATGVALSSGLGTHAGWVIAGALCSPSVMLLVERGNVDSAVFVLVALAGTLAGSPRRSRRILGYFLLWLSASLKLFPIFAATLTLGERGRHRGVIALGALLAAFALLASCTWSDIEIIQRTVPRNVGGGYGAGVLPRGLGYLGSGPDGWSERIPSVIALGVALAGGALGIMRPARVCHSAAPDTTFRPRWFLAGTSIYVGTFALGHNWAYRLMFLLLTLPALLEWSRTARAGRSVALALVGLELALLHLAPLEPGPTRLEFVLWATGQIVGWLLVFGLSWASAARVALLVASQATLHVRGPVPGDPGGIRTLSDRR